MMLPKSRRARVPADYRPIASVRLLYKIFAYMMLARVEPALEIHQPEEQHRFRKGHRIEEHLLTANLVVTAEKKIKPRKSIRGNLYLLLKSIRGNPAATLKSIRGNFWVAFKARLFRLFCFLFCLLN